MWSIEYTRCENQTKPARKNRAINVAWNHVKYLSNDTSVIFHFAITASNEVLAGSSIGCIFCVLELAHDAEDVLHVEFAWVFERNTQPFVDSRSFERSD